RRRRIARRRKRGDRSRRDAVAPRSWSADSARGAAAIVRARDARRIFRRAASLDARRSRTLIAMPVRHPPATEIVAQVRSGRQSPSAAVAEALARARAADESRKLNIFLHRADKYGNARASELDDSADSRASDAVLPLLGVPFAVKDNISVAGLPTTCGSKILDGYVSAFTAAAVKRL